MRRSKEPTQARSSGKAKWAMTAAMALAAAAPMAGQTGGPIGKNSKQPEAPQRRVVVSLPDRKLALLEDGRLLKIYPVAVGAPASPSPSGEFKIVHLIPDPAYYAPGIVIPPGKANPLGTRWLGLSVKGYGIHGTNEPRSIGRRASHGCIRMRNRDVEELFELVRAGEVVEVHGKRTVQVAQMFDVAGARARKPAAGQEAAAPVVVAAIAGQM